MGPENLEDEQIEPLLLEGTLSRENLPKEVGRDAHFSGQSSRRPTSVESLSKKDVSAGVSENQIKDAQLLADLQERIKSGDKDAKFELGQFYFDRRDFEEAKGLFEEITDENLQATYQLAVIYYDGLGVEANQKKAVGMMESIINSKDKEWDFIVPYAQYQLGRAYYEGFGVKQSDTMAEHLWTLAARDGNPDGSVKAQTTLGMFYSRPGENTYNIHKAHFWHQEATGNGSHESQAALGILYLHGLGVNKDTKSSFQCLKNAAERGNIYAIGQLSFFYYRLKLYNNAVDFAQRIVWITDATEAAEKTGCLVHYVKKGIAISCFLYGRCLSKGYGIKRDATEALLYYTKAAEFDLDIANQLQELMIHGKI